MAGTKSHETGRYTVKMVLTSARLALGLVGVGFGLFWLYRAFATGRALGRFGFADRSTQPVWFWFHVAGLIGIMVLSSMQVVLPVLEQRGFRSGHPVATDRDLPMNPVARLSAKGCEQPGPRVCFVVAGAPPDVPVDLLAEYGSGLVGSPVGILDPIALTRQAEGLPLIDEQRSQVGTGALARLVGATYPRLWSDRDVTLVILTGNDLWLESSPNQRYALGAVTVRNSGGGFAIVSSARMAPARFGLASDPAVRERRLHVLLGKYLAMLLYGATPSMDPTSPVYNAVRSPADLDRMRPFTPPR